MKTCQYCLSEIANNAKKCKYCDEIVMEEKKVKLCPYCESEISETARKCKYCWEWVNEQELNDENIKEEYKAVDDWTDNPRKVWEQIIDYAKNYERNRRIEATEWFIWNVIDYCMNKLSACSPLLPIVFYAVLSIIFPAIYIIFKQGDWSMLIAYPIFLIIIMTWYWHHKFWNTVIFFGWLYIALAGWAVFF